MYYYFALPLRPLRRTKGTTVCPLYVDQNSETFKASPGQIIRIEKKTRKLPHKRWDIEKRADIKIRKDFFQKSARFITLYIQEVKVLHLTYFVLISVLLLVLAVGAVLAYVFREQVHFYHMYIKFWLQSRNSHVIKSRGGYMHSIQGDDKLYYGIPLHHLCVMPSAIWASI